MGSLPRALPLLLAFVACVVFASRDAGAVTIGPPVVLADDATSSSFRSATPDGGDVTVDYFANGEFRQRTSTDGGRTFGSEMDGSAALEERYNHPFLDEVVTGGHIYQIWKESDAVIFRRSDDGGETWTEEFIVTADAGFFAPKLAAIDERVYLMYYELGDPEDPVFMRSSADGGDTWGNPVELPTYGFIDIVALPSGGVVGSTYLGSGVFFYSYPGGVVQGAPIAVELDRESILPGANSMTTQGEALKAGLDDEAAITFNLSDVDALAAVLAVTTDAGLTWHAHVLNDPEAPDSTNVTAPIAAPAPDGGFWAAWSQTDNVDPPRVYTARTSATGTTISGRSLVRETGPDTSIPQVMAVSRGEVLYVAWAERHDIALPAMVQLATVYPGESPKVKPVDDTRTNPFVSFHQPCPVGRDCTGPDADAGRMLYLAWSSSTFTPPLVSDTVLVTLWLSGDSNCDGLANLDDMLGLLQSEAGLGDVPCADAADANCDEVTTVEDALAHLFAQADLPIPDAPSNCPAIGT
jgi:hypothetical protein